MIHTNLGIIPFVCVSDHRRDLRGMSERFSQQCSSETTFSESRNALFYGAIAGQRKSEAKFRRARK